MFRYLGETYAFSAPGSDRTLPSRLAKRFLPRPSASRNDLDRLAKLTDHQLRDIGVDPNLLTKSIAGEPERIGLLDLGWQAPRQSRRD